MARNSIPTNVIVGHQNYEIKVEHTTLTDTSQGECFTDKHSIIINTAQHPREIPNTILHEVLHAIWHTKNLSSALKIKDANDAEEHIVMLIANGLTEVLIHNPQFRKWLNRNISKVN